MCIVGRTKFSAVYVGLICRKVGAYGKISSPYAFIIGVKKERTISLPRYSRFECCAVRAFEKIFFFVSVVVGGFGVWDIIIWDIITWAF